jgi:hypothetical protein
MLRPVRSIYGPAPRKVVFSYPYQATMANPTNTYDVLDNNLFPLLLNQGQSYQFDSECFMEELWLQPPIMDWDTDTGTDQATMGLNPESFVSNAAFLESTTVLEEDKDIGNSVNPHECGKDIEQRMEDR